MTCEHDYHWYPAINETGWKCSACGHRPGDPEGYSPQLDREELGRKVFAMCSELHDADIVHFSNSCHGDAAAARVADRCRNSGYYDQETIAAYILDGFAESDYWKDLGDQLIAGVDPRERCDVCGALATCFQGDKKWCGGKCRDQGRLPF